MSLSIPYNISNSGFQTTCPVWKRRCLIVDCRGKSRPNIAHFDPPVQIRTWLGRYIGTFEYSCAYDGTSDGRLLSHLAAPRSGKNKIKGQQQTLRPSDMWGPNKPINVLLVFAIMILGLHTKFVSSVFITTCTIQCN